MALSFGIGGGLYLLVEAVADWRKGRRPWMPTRRVIATEFDKSPSIRRGSIIGVVAAKLTVIGLWAFVTYTVYQAGLEGIAASFVFLGATYVVARLALDLRAGRPPWLPMDRVPLFE